jgi:hypothetical protein
MYFPAGHLQSATLVLFAALVVPEGQLVWLAAPDGQYFPAVQALQVVLLPSL